MKLKHAKTILAVVCLCLLIYSPCPAQDENDWEWVNQYFQGVLDEFLPIREQRGQHLGYRSYRDLYTEVLEYSFAFSKDIQENRIYVTVRMADRVSLYDQLMTLHKKNRSESIDSIKKRLKIIEWRFTDDSCPSIKNLDKEFYSMKLSTTSDKDKANPAKGVFTIPLHPTVHTFRANVSGEVVELELTEQDHPFVVWARKTRKALDRCVSKK